MQAAGLDGVHGGEVVVVHVEVRRAALNDTAVYFSVHNPWRMASQIAVRGTLPLFMPSGSMSRVSTQ